MREFVQQIHFVGIGGVGMSGIASVLLDQGYRVSGSDLVVGQLTRRLAERGAVIDVGHEARHITGADVVVVSTAVSTENVEVEAARNAGIPSFGTLSMSNLAVTIASGSMLFLVGTSRVSSDCFTISILATRRHRLPTRWRPELLLTKKSPSVIAPRFVRYSVYALKAKSAEIAVMIPSGT